MSNRCVIHLTGDIVNDFHLYVAPTDDVLSGAERGTALAERLGGAVLTRDLLRAAAGAGGRDPVAVELGLEADAAQASAAPASLRSYGVWTTHAAGPKSKEMVWRVAPDGG